jgi:serine/threonine protein kinase
VLIKKLAEGGMAEIFLAKQVGVEGFEKNVVVKRMLRHLSHIPDFVSMFLDEARLAASLSHPNIVAISDLGFAEDCYYIAMEYLPGEDFSAILRVAKRRGEPLPLNIVLRIIAEVATGLHHAHEATDNKGKPLLLVHRDVSPSNMFVLYAGQVKVLDFGIAKAESRVTNTTAGVVKGKYQYMSPEQATSKTVDRRSDVYSLGVSLYEALTLTRPFARETDLAVLNAVLKSEYLPIRQLRPDLPVEVENIVQTAMSTEMDRRFATAADMAAAIEEYLGATTSASGNTVLTGFMHGFFGPERVRVKTRISSLEEMAAQGIDVPGFRNPKSPKTEGAAVSPIPFTSPSQPGPQSAVSAATKVLPSESKAPSSRRRVVVIGALAALLTAVAAGTFAFWPREKEVPAEPKITRTPPDIEPNQTLDSGTVATVTPEPTVTTSVDAGSPAPEVKRPIKVHRKSMDERVSSLIAAQKAKFQSCVAENRKEMPPDLAVIALHFEVAANGSVQRLTTPFSGTALGLCLESVGKAIVFPKDSQPWEITPKLKIAPR